jgi:AraC-like DNA-binding protein
VRPSTLEERRRLYLLARATIARHYRRPLTLEHVARALASSPRQLTRAYAQFGQSTFREDLLTRRMRAAAQLLIEQPSIPVRDVARIVGYRQAPHFAKAFRHRYGLNPAAFRIEGRTYARRCATGADARPSTAVGAAETRLSGPTVERTNRALPAVGPNVSSAGRLDTTDEGERGCAGFSSATRSGRARAG